jgi:hypothetical protein
VPELPQFLLEGLLLALLQAQAELLALDVRKFCILKKNQKQVYNRHRFSPAAATAAKGKKE